jgi:hypothetical protein
MVNSAESIRWICSICGAKYSTHDGGICDACSRPVCLSHLFVVEESFEKGLATSKRVYQVKDSLQLIVSIRRENKNKVKLNFLCTKCIGDSK